jgi:3-isopropylmalate/(R)-2-methylmalate dehydratase small subunit
MTPFTVLEAVAAPLLRANVDTDLIIRIERCTQVAREDMGRWAFEMIRFDEYGAERGEFILNQPAFKGARILVCGANFGCGSSREMAVWALAGLGIRCVIAPSFGDIFFSNCFQNGLLPIVLPQHEVERLQSGLLEAASASGPVSMSVDLEQCELSDTRGTRLSFDVDPLKRNALLRGLDEIGQTLMRLVEIQQFQDRDRQLRPWIYRA